MILVFLVFSILLIVLGTWINYHLNNADGSIFFVSGIITTLITVIAIVFLIVNVSKSFIIDEKISMYQKENKNIETSITKVVENYKDYEKEIFENVKPEEVVLVATQVYPELKSNTLVEKQIKIYLDNNEKVKELKEDKINYKACKWWLYFG